MLLFSKVQVTFETKLDQDLVVSFNKVGYNYTHTWVVLAASPSDKIYGGGEQFTHLNLRERTFNSLEFFSSLRSDDLTYPIWTREQGACPLHRHKVKILELKMLHLCDKKNNSCITSQTYTIYR